jgi:superfamily II DNA or RNA helicase
MIEKDYLTIKKASQYIGVSPQTLRRWDEEGKLRPVRHPASSYRYYKRADLEPFRLDYRRAEAGAESPRHLFQTATANVEENERLREPQREAHRAIREHFAETNEHAILQIPVGCGKTGIMATLPFGISDGRVLVITPNLTIRKGVSEALDIASPKCFWNKTRVLNSVADGPFSAVLDGPSANLHDCTDSHFVITNIQQLASSADRWLPQFPPRFFDMILVDEGHHNVAESWKKVFDRFPEAKVISLTATPFRSDGQPVTGKLVYRYSYARAMINGYIKEIHSVNVAPADIYFTYHDDERHHTLEEVMDLKEEAWFRRGVALSPECNKHIAEASILRCLSLRKRTGLRHQIIAAACSIDHARQVRSIYEQLGLEAREIYSEMDPEKQEKTLAELQDGRIDCIVQVQMLGEGFDHPPLSVAAIFRPFRSLSPYIQFVGRIMRVIHENDPGHPDNHGYVVSHIGLNNDSNWRDFRDVDFEDQEIFRRWVRAKPMEESEDGEGQPRRFDIGMQVKDEIISHFIGSAFLNPDDDRVLDEILAQKVPGTPFKLSDLTSREELRARLKVAQQEHEQKPEAIPVSPQRRRRTTRISISAGVKIDQ